MDIPPPPPPPPSPDDVPPSGIPPYPGSQGHPQSQNPYAAPPQQPTQAAMPGVPQEPTQAAMPGPPPNPYGTPEQPPNPYAAPGQPQYGAPGQPQNPYAAPGQPQNPYAASGYGYPAGQPAYGYPGPGMPPPYPGQAGWYAAERNTNGMSIAALVTGLIPCTLFLSTIFGLVGLKQVKQRGERGRGMAVSGVVLGIVWTLATALLITLGAMGLLDDGNTAVTDLKAGQCFNTVGEKLSDFGSADKDKRRTTSVDVVDCADDHDAEAFDVYQIQAGRDDPYPGVASVSADAQTNCLKFARTYLDGKKPASGIGLFFYIPPADNWAHNQRSVICFFGSPGGKVTGTVKDGAGATSSGDQENGDDSSGGVGV
ncbi:MAG: DUF4190 domain-containing protein [Streptomyces sp.]|nr:DUF4190 domain-containing protein [Streptomyces sp.]